MGLTENSLLLTHLSNILQSWKVDHAYTIDIFKGFQHTDDCFGCGSDFLHKVTLSGKICYMLGH